MYNIFTWFGFFSNYVTNVRITIFNSSGIIEFKNYKTAYFFHELDSGTKCEAHLACWTISVKCAAGLSRRNFNSPRPTVAWVLQTTRPSSHALVSACRNAITGRIGLLLSRWSGSAGGASTTVEGKHCY